MRNNLAKKGLATMRIALFMFLFVGMVPLWQIKDLGIELICDRNFSNGVGVESLNSASTIIDTLYPFGRSHTHFSWKLAQWFSHFVLKGVHPEKVKGGVVYSNQGKRISFTRIHGSTRVTMEVFGSKEYRAPRRYGEGWPHLLLEENFPNPPRLDSIVTLNLSMRARLLYCVNKMDSLTYNPELHTAQYSMYLVVQNMNKFSSDYHDYFWFGLHLYDYRYKGIPRYEAQDKGKKDATRKFIYCPSSNDLHIGDFQGGRWVVISSNLLPWIVSAFKTAQSRGYLRGSRIADMKITGMNIGWEVTGTFDCGFQYDDLTLGAVLRNDRH